MKFFERIAVLLYVTFVMFISCLMIVFVSNVFDIKGIYEGLYIYYTDDNLRIIIGSIAGGLLFLNYIFYRHFSVNVHSDKIIAFDNPSGRVSVSLFAMEDIVKRTMLRMSEIKEGKTYVTASKKGLLVKVKLILRSETNIPEIASRVQEKVTRKIQDMIGLDEPINVTIFVGKILSEKIKTKHIEDKQETDVKPEPNVPFQGYRA